MIINQEAFRMACIRLANAYLRLANCDELPTTELMIDFSNVADDMTAYVSAKHRNVELAHDGPRMASNVVTFERRAR